MAGQTDAARDREPRNLERRGWGDAGADVMRRDADAPRPGGCSFPLRSRRPVPMPDVTTAPPRLVVRDAAACRILAGVPSADRLPAPDDAAAVTAALAAARRAGAEAGAADRAAGLLPAASPATLWALLADAAPEPELEGRSKKRAAATDAGSPAHARRALRARLALVACLAHAAPDDAPTDADAPLRAPRLAPDPDLVLAHAVAGALPQAAEAWGAYLASLAVDVANEGTPTRLAGPLAHVAERAGQVANELADEVQDAVLAGYDAAGGAEGDAWADDADEAARQAIVAAQGAPLEAALALGRGARGWHLVGGAKTPTQADAATGCVAEAFAPGLALWREVVRRVIGGDVELAGRRWRGTLWTLQTAFALDAAPPPARPQKPLVSLDEDAPQHRAAVVEAAPVAVVVTGDPLVVRAAEAAGLTGVRAAR